MADLNTKDDCGLSNKMKDINIHSGHFMMSQLDDEESDSKFSKNINTEIDSNSAQTYVYGRRRDHSFAIDSSLSKLFECMTLAYSGKITSPKWKQFRGTKLTLKDKVRLNNIIWREWTMQYIYSRQGIICQFAFPLNDDIHTKPEAVVLEGKYWKRRLDSVTAEYLKCRRYFMQMVRRRGQLTYNKMSDQELLERVGKVTHSVPKYKQQSPDYFAATSFLEEDFSMDFSDSLFTSLDMPFAFPTPKDLYKTAYRNVVQPGLAQLQPNLNTLDLAPIHEMFTEHLRSDCNMQPGITTDNGLPMSSPINYQIWELSNENWRKVRNPIIRDVPLMPNLSYAIQDNTPTSYSAVPRNSTLVNRNHGMNVVASQAAVPQRSPPYISAKSSINSQISQAKYHAHPTISPVHKQPSPRHPNDIYSPEIIHPSIQPVSKPPGEGILAKLIKDSSPEELPPPKYNISKRTLMFKQKSDPSFLIPTGKPAGRKPRAIAPAISCPTIVPNQQASCLAQLLCAGSPIIQTDTRTPQHFILAPPWPNSTALSSTDVVNNSPQSSINPTAQQSLKLLPQPSLNPQPQSSLTPMTIVSTDPSFSMKIRRSSGGPSRQPLTEKVRRLSGEPSNRNAPLELVATVKRADNVPVHKVKPLVSQPVNEPVLTGSLPSHISQVSITTTPASQPHSEYDQFEQFILSESDKDQRRSTTVSSEKKRRHNIKQTGFNLLYDIVPSLKMQPNAKVSKALMLHKAAEYCRKLKQDRSHAQQEACSLKHEIETLNSSIVDYQSMLPETGVPVTRQRVDKMNHIFDAYVKTRTMENWKFWLFSLIIRDLFDAFNNTVSTATSTDLRKTVISWLEQRCSLLQLRPSALASLRTLSTSTCVLSDPASLKAQIMQSLNLHDEPAD